MIDEHDGDDEGQYSHGGQESRERDQESRRDVVAAFHAKEHDTNDSNYN